MPLPTRNKRTTSSYSPALLNLGGGGKGSRNGRSGKKRVQAALSFHSAFPRLQKKAALVISWKDTTEGAIRTLQ